MDFYTIVVNRRKSNNRSADCVVESDFKNRRSKDLICKGGSLYAFWDDDHWEQNIYRLVEVIDNDILKKVDEVKSEHPDWDVQPKLLSSNSSKKFEELDNYFKRRTQSDVVFNSKIFFASHKPKREDYSTNRLPYDPKEGDTTAFDTLLEKLYSESEREKILWFMGALLTNNMSRIQKFIFLYGAKGSGKGTVIHIFKKMFEGYWAPINLKKLTSGGEFNTDGVRELPILIDEDSDLSSITNDIDLLKLTAHEPVVVNKKYQKPYESIFNGLLITASNQRYKVRNVDSGITRRAVVVEPTNFTFDSKTYFDLMERINYEIPAIAWKAMEVFNSRGVYYYEDYVDLEMIESTDYIFSFVNLYKDTLGDSVTLERASALYKEYLEDLGFDTRGYKRKIKTELQRYYRKFYNQKKVDGMKLSNVYEGFKSDIFSQEEKNKESLDLDWLVLAENQESLMETHILDCPAQYATDKGTPSYSWDKCRTTLKDIDTSKLHYVRVPENHIVIDFDLKDPLTGAKDIFLNAKAANKFPPTYAEVSKSGQGLHLHYIYDGDVSRLSRIYDDGIEVKIFTGKSSLRRKLSLCNCLDVTHISTGLPLKEEVKKMYNDVKDWVWTESQMRVQIKRALAKEIHKDTSSSIDWIAHIFEQAQAQGLKYDLSDLKTDIDTFAAMSTNQSRRCKEVCNHICYCTIDYVSPSFTVGDAKFYDDKDIWFFDIEVAPNKWLVVAKQYGDHEPVIFVNPTPEQVEWLLKKPLCGYNNNRYDNHIMYEGLRGSSPATIYQVSQQIVGNGKKGSGRSRVAEYLAYCDLYDIASIKKSLKWWENEMGILHDEFEIGFDVPITDELEPRWIEYCKHDVLATEALFNYIYEDYNARKMYAALSGQPMCVSSLRHATYLFFSEDMKNYDSFKAKSYLKYTDLSKEFPGYTFDPITRKSLYMGIDPKEGGYVYSKPGKYNNVVCLDVASMHPTSIEILGVLGENGTRIFSELKQVRVHIKHGEFDKARELFGGRLKPYLNDESKAKELSHALKIIINSVYGYTSAKFDNAFRDPRNIDNIVAKRGALFMITLQHACEEKGYQVVHIKTDSIKIANCTEEAKEFVMNFGKKYGYTFEIEDIFKKFTLLNKAVYIGETEDGFEAKGAMFQHPFVFKTLFSGEELDKKDFMELKEVTGSARIFLGDKFIGKVANVYSSTEGEPLMRIDGEKKGYVTGTKGYLWKEAKDFKTIKDVDMAYYKHLVVDAVKAINEVAPSGDVVCRVEPYFSNLLTYY
jgi:hypothetical protein